MKKALILILHDISISNLVSHSQDIVGSHKLLDFPLLAAPSIFLFHLSESTSNNAGSQSSTKNP